MENLRAMWQTKGVKQHTCNLPETVSSCQSGAAFHTYTYALVHADCPAPVRALVHEQDLTRPG